MIADLPMIMPMVIVVMAVRVRPVIMSEGAAVAIGAALGGEGRFGQGQIRA